MSKSDHNHGTGERDYTDKDIRVRPLFIFLMISLAFMGLTFIGIIMLFNKFYRDQSAADQFSNVYSMQRQLPQGGVVLQSFQQSARDLKALHEKEDALLHKYEWVNQQDGVVRIPIDQAIDRALAKGYPVRETPAKP